VTAVLWVLVAVLGLALLDVAASPTPALTARLNLEGVCGIGYRLGAWVTGWAAEALGAWRPYQANPGPPPYTDVPVYRPTAVGRRVALYEASLLERAARLDFARLFVPEAATQWQANADWIRRCMDGATWCELVRAGLVTCPCVTCEKGGR
jgi:hypothetical protein